MPESNISIGIDINEKSVKFVKLRQANGEVSLLKYAVNDVPSAEDKVKAVASILKDLFKDEKPDTEIHASAFGTNVSQKRITIPIMPDEEIANALKWEAKNQVPFPTENAAIDYFKIGQISEKAVEKLDIMFAVAGDDLINFFEAVSKEAGIKLRGISTVPFALCSILSLNKKCEKDKVTAIIDIGGEAASINLFKGDTLHFTREITVAGDSFTKAMTGLLVADQWQLNLTYEQAEDIKKKYGVPKKDTSETTESGIPLIHIYEMMAPTLRRLQNEILRSFDYYKEQFREEKIDAIYLTGGSSSIKNLDEYLSNAIGIKVETINPLENIKIDPAAGIDQSALQAISSRLTLAIGLALNKSQKINLLRAKEKPRKGQLNIDELLKTLKLDGVLKNVKIQVPVNAIIAVFVLVLVVAISYNLYLSNVRNNLKKELASKQALLTDVKALVERKSILEQISQEESRVKETLSQLAAALPAGVTLVDLTFDNARRQIWLSGEARDTKVVGSLLKNLEDAQAFRKTVLIEARKSMIEGASKILFKITFNLS